MTLRVSTNILKHDIHFNVIVLYVYYYDLLLFGDFLEIICSISLLLLLMLMLMLMMLFMVWYGMVLYWKRNDAVTFV